MNKLLLDKENAYLLDKMAIDKGASLSDLMETAGKRSAKIIIVSFQTSLILCRFVSNVWVN